MRPCTPEAPAINDDALREALQTTLSGHFGTPCHVTRLRCQPSMARSTFTLEELDVTLEDGTAIPLIFKDVHCGALVRDRQWAKPGFLCAPLREIETYRKILAPARLGTATYYGAVIDAQMGRYWLFLERVHGVDLQQSGWTTWLQVAQWLADMHVRFTGATSRLSAEAPLLRYDAAYYRRWLRRARASLHSHVLASTARRDLDWLAPRHERAVEQLVALPATFIHGEFYASNVLIEQHADELRICPVDWELAAIGPGLIDLAALTAGDWTEQERETLAMAYYARLPQSGGWPPSPDVFLAALDCCRLHLAVQWLGWSGRSTQAPHEGRDWLGEAVRLAARLNL